MTSPPWDELAVQLCRLNHQLHEANCIPLVLKVVSELEAWALLYVPPFCTPANSRVGLPTIFGATAGAILEADSTFLEEQWQYVVRVLQTTALFFYKAYTKDGGTMEAAAALNIAQQVVQSALLRQGGLRTAFETAAERLTIDATAADVATPAMQAHMHIGFALLQLFSALDKMWPSSIIKSKDAAPALAPAADLAVSLLQAAGRQEQLTADMRVERILCEGLHLAKSVVQQLAPCLENLRQNLKDEVFELQDVIKELASSASFVLLLLLLLEVQLQQLLLQQQQQGCTAVMRAHSTASVAYQSAENTARSSSSGSLQEDSQQAQMQCDVTTISANIQQSHANLLQQLGKPSQQQWDFLCRTNSSHNSVSNSSSNLGDDASEVCVATLRTIAAALCIWRLVSSSKQHAEQGISTTDLHMLQPVLPTLPLKLLQLALDSLAAAQVGSAASSTSRLHKAAIEAASQAWCFVTTAGMSTDILPMPEMLQLATHYLALLAGAIQHAAVTPAQTAVAAGGSVISSSCPNHDQECVVQVLNVLVDIAQVSQCDAGLWAPHAVQIASSLERCCRFPAAAVAASVQAAAGVNCAYKVPGILALPELVHQGLDRMNPLAVVAHNRVAFREPLFSLLLSSSKVMLELELDLGTCLRIVCTITSSAVCLCSKTLPDESSDGSISNATALLAVPWLWLYLHAIRHHARSLQLAYAELDSAAAELTAAPTQSKQKRYTEVWAPAQDRLGCMSTLLVNSVIELLLRLQQLASSIQLDSSERSPGLGRWHTVPAARSPAVAAVYCLGLEQCIQQVQQLLPVVQAEDDMLNAAADHAPTLREFAVQSKSKGPLPRVGRSRGANRAKEPGSITAARTAKQLANTMRRLSHAVALKQQIEDVTAVIVAALPVPHCCNNLHCKNLDGASELELVGGSSCVCAGCNTARYCSRACQKAAWQLHKPVCRRLKAAAAAAGIGKA